MAKKKPAFYAVKDGKNGDGIYRTWAECESEVNGVSNVKYKKFSTQEDAENFINFGKQISSEQVEPVKNNKSDIKPGHINVYVDGSYNKETNTYGYGVYMDDGRNQRIICGKGTCQYGGRNVEGEVAAARTALFEISKSGKYDSVTLYHDYQGIGSWADGDWRTNKEYTQSYQAFVNNIRSQGLDIDFRHVDGHSGVRGNEYCDKLAKVACGMELTPSDRKIIQGLHSVDGCPKSEDDIPDDDMSAEAHVVEDYDSSQDSFDLNGQEISYF